MAELKTVVWDARVFALQCEDMTEIRKLVIRTSSHAGVMKPGLSILVCLSVITELYRLLHIRCFRQFNCLEFKWFYNLELVVWPHRL